MAVIYGAAVRTARMQAVLAAIDQDVGAGKLNLYDAGAVLLASFDFSDPAGSVSGDVLTFTVPKQTVGIANGTPTNATITDNSGDVIVSGLTVGTSGTNVIVSEPTTTIGRGATLIAASLTHNTSGT